MWVPRWLGEAYSKLFVRFGLGLFSLRDAQEALGVDSSKARVLLYHLHRRGLVLVFERKRPRAYRLLSPENFNPASIE